MMIFIDFLTSIILKLCIFVPWGDGYCIPGTLFLCFLVALNTTKEANGESQEEAIKEQQRIQEDENAKLSSALDVDDTSCISPSDPVLIGLGRGKISPMCVQPTQQYQGRPSSLSMEASVECEQIQSFLHNGNTKLLPFCIIFISYLMMAVET